MNTELPAFLKPAGYYMLDHYNQLKEGECLVVIPNDPRDGKGYTTKAIKIEDLK